MDKATPTPSPATVDSVMKLARECAHKMANAANWHALTAEVERLAAQAAPTKGDTQAVRMLTPEEADDVWLSEHQKAGEMTDDEWDGVFAAAIQRKFAEVNGLRIPADGKIGDAA